MLDPADIELRIRLFREDLSVLTSVQMIRKHVIYGECAVISSAQYFDLRSEVADRYEVHPNEVLVVGSGKLGFSIAPTKLYRPFTDTSDIDVVIVSPKLFDRIWKAVHHYWDHGGYWERSAQFKAYLFQGWIRPDKLPPSRAFELANEWWQFFNSLSSTGRYSIYKIAGALYRDWYFLEAYQLRGVSACADELR
jgi:predicted nucleotidyltransferase